MTVGKIEYLSEKLSESVKRFKDVDVKIATETDKLTNNWSLKHELYKSALNGRWSGRMQSGWTLSDNLTPVKSDWQCTLA